MVQLTVEIVRSTIRNGEQLLELRVPALTNTGARRRAMLNSRVKGLRSPTIESIERIPEENLFEVTVTAPR